MSRIDSQVSAVQFRLTLSVLVEWLATAAFALACGTLLLVIVERLFHFGIPPMTFWVGLGLVAIIAIVMTFMRSPTRQAAAVALDDRLDLKEKFSTALSVRAMEDPFAQAVVRDAENTAQRVRLDGHFGVNFPTIGYFAIAAVVLALLTFMFFPSWDLLGREQKKEAKRQDEIKIADNKVMVKDAIAKLERIPPALADHEQVKLAKAELMKLLADPGRDRSAAARKVMDAMDKADQGLKEKAKENKNFAQAQANQKMFKSMNVPIDQKGPVADAHRELVKGDYEEAVKKLDEAVKELEKMSPKEKEEAAKQMQNMAQQLQQMANDPRQMEKLAEQMKQAGANQQQIKQMQQAMQQAAQNPQDKQAQQQMQQLQQQLAQQMQQAGMNQQQIQQMQQAMQQAQQGANAQAQANGMAQAAQQMAQAMQQAAQNGGAQNGQQMADAQKQMAEQLQQMQGAAQDAKQLQQMQQAMQQAMAQAAGQCDGNGDKPGNKPGQGAWKAGDPNNNQGAGMGGPGQGFGGQGQKTGAPYSTKEELSKSYYDEKGKHLASIYVKDRSIKGESKLKLQEVIKAGEADEGDDVDDSRADRRTQEVQRRYFKVMEDALK
jgi:myosin heavy subunit